MFLYSFSVMALEPKVWGPHYWFFIQTIALQYPTMPNEVTKKKYYDFIQNLPLFIPHREIGNKFSEYLDNYPVTFQAKLIAWHQKHILVQLHTQDAVNRASERKSKK